jgi:hypothetical protein
MAYLGLRAARLRHRGRHVSDLAFRFIRVPGFGLAFTVYKGFGFRS